MNRAWTLVMRLATRIGHLQAWIILTVCYFVLLAPLAVIFKLCTDPLRLRHRHASMWHPRTPPGDRWGWAKAQH